MNANQEKLVKAYVSNIGAYKPLRPAVLFSPPQSKLLINASGIPLQPGRPQGVCDFRWIVAMMGLIRVGATRRKNRSSSALSATIPSVVFRLIQPAVPNRFQWLPPTVFHDSGAVPEQTDWHPLIQHHNFGSLATLAFPRPVSPFLAGNTRQRWSKQV